MQIEEIIEAINASRVLLSRHNIKEAAADNLIPEDIYQSVIENGEIIEDYPQAYPMPACLILGFKTTGEPIHSVWGYDETNRVARLITVYHPQPNRWINWRIRT